MYFVKQLNTFLLVLLLPTAIYADNLCRAPYALMHNKFNYKAYVNSTKGVNSYTVAVLWNTFGTDTKNLKAELARPEVNGLELILANENCAKYPRCGKYELFAGMNTDKIRKLLRNKDPKFKAKVEAYAQNAATIVNPLLRPDQKRYLNPLLESKCSRAEWQTFAEWIRPFFADWTFVWNPLGAKPGLPQPPGSISEGHGDNPKFIDGNCIANPDGTSIDPADWESYFRKYSACVAVCGWTSADNCIVSGQKGFIDPRKRSCSDVSKMKAVGVGMLEAQKPYELVPEWSSSDDASLVGCTTIRPNPDGVGGFIWKQSHVPGYGATILFPAKYGKFNKVLIKKAGKTIGSVKWAPGKGFPDQAKGNIFRPIWRTSLSAKKYPYNIAIHGLIDGKRICWRVSNPKVRND